MSDDSQQPMSSEQFQMLMEEIKKNLGDTQEDTRPIAKDQFQMLMDKIKKNRDDVQHRLDKLEGDVASRQTLKADRSYTFKKKGHEEQYRFNVDIEGYFNKAQAEAGKIQPATEKEQKSMVALKNQLKEGIQAIACRQKRIKVADHSDYGQSLR